jgi:hypothetical protein
MCTRNDLSFQSQVNRPDLAAFSAKFNLPIYFIKNLRTPTPSDSLQTEKDTMKIKNDLAEFILSGVDFGKKVKIFKVCFTIRLQIAYCCFFTE